MRIAYFSGCIQWVVGATFIDSSYGITPQIACKVWSGAGNPNNNNYFCHKVREGKNDG